MSKKAATYGMLVALAFLLGYVESLIPVSAAMPGVKLGLANLVTVAAMYGMGERQAVSLTLVRILLVSFTFGNLSMLVYSLAGGFLSLLFMLLAKRFTGLSIVGVSILGGVTHNLGQLLLAAAVLQTEKLMYYFPVLMAAGLAAGLVIGLLGGLVLARIRPVLREHKR